MSDPGDDLAAYLDAQGYGEWKNASPVLNSIFRDELPDLPANCIGIWINNGQGSEYCSGGVLEYPIADIIIRNTSKATARDTAEAIRQHFTLGVLLTGYVSQRSSCSYPRYLGKDDSNRYKFSIEIQFALCRAL